MLPVRPPKRDRMADNGPTEEILEETRDLDQWSISRILQAIHAQDRLAVAAVGRVLPDVERAVGVLVTTLGGGGRWFNVGAGTSGRMGALDAAEIPPTFGLRPDRVQAVVAGGERAMMRAVEGAEDDANAAGEELRRRGLCAGDAVLAISASGHTPFALGALAAAHAARARKLCITCNPHSALAEAAEIAMVPHVGPEVIAGSTRLKGGLAQKMLLHLLSTTVMVRLGYTEGNLMSHLNPGSRKLQQRAVRIVMALGPTDERRALETLGACDGDVSAAVARIRSHAPR